MSTVDHIAILVDDLKIAEEWYLNKMDAFVSFRDEKYIRLTTKNTNIALIDKNHYEHAHFAILVDNKKDLPINYIVKSKPLLYAGQRSIDYDLGLY